MSEGNGIDVHGIHLDSLKSSKLIDWNSASTTRFLQFFLTALLVAGVSFDLTGTKQLNRLLLLAAVVLLIARPTGNPFLSHWLLVWVGDVSYSVYLVHWPLFEWHRYWDVKMYSFNGTTTIFGSSTPSFLHCRLFAAGVCLIAASFLTGWLVESGYHRVAAWINSWSRLLVVVGGCYATIGFTCSFLRLTAVTQNVRSSLCFQLTRIRSFSSPWIPPYK